MVDKTLKYAFAILQINNKNQHQLFINPFLQDLTISTNNASHQEIRQITDLDMKEIDKYLDLIRHHPFQNIEKHVARNLMIRLED